MVIVSKVTSRSAKSWTSESESCDWKKLFQWDTEKLAHLCYCLVRYATVLFFSVLAADNMSCYALYHLFVFISVLWYVFTFLPLFFVLYLNNALSEQSSQKNGFSGIVFLADLMKSALSSVSFMHHNISLFSHAFWLRFGSTVLTQHYKELMTVDCGDIEEHNWISL